MTTYNAGITRRLWSQVMKSECIAPADCLRKSNAETREQESFSIPRVPCHKNACVFPVSYCSHHEARGAHPANYAPAKSQAIAHITMEERRWTPPRAPREAGHKICRSWRHEPLLALLPFPCSRTTSLLLSCSLPWSLDFFVFFFKICNLRQGS